MRRLWYAISHRYGAHACDNRGNHIGDVVAFSSKAKRDFWVAESPTDYQTEAGYREALKANDPQDLEAIRRWQRYEQQTSPVDFKLLSADERYG